MEVTAGKTVTDLGEDHHLRSIVVAGRRCSRYLTGILSPLLDLALFC
jgi:hypothetical protein